MESENEHAPERERSGGRERRNVVPLLPKPPSELQRIRGWLVWRYEQQASGKKPRKIPYYASGSRRTGKQGSTDDFRELVTFKDAQAAAARMRADGVGLALLPSFGIVALDFDNCVDEGRVRDDVARLACATYAELSPSGCGVRAFFKGALRSRKSFAWQGFDFDVEFFGDSGFVTYTGEMLEACEVLGNQDTVAELTPEILVLYEERSGRAPATPGTSSAAPADRDPLDAHEPRLELTLEQMREALAKLDPDMPEPEWVKVGWAIHHETAGSDAGLALWHEWSSGQLAGGAGASKYDERACDEKWSHAGHRGGRPVTFRSVLKMAKAVGTPPAPGAFKFLPWSECDHAAPTEWLIKGVIPKAELGMVYGESGSGKSFFVLDLVGAIARGEPWRGHRTRRARVVYVAAEGAPGFRMRVKAYREHHKVTDADSMMILGVAPNLLHDPSTLIAAIAGLGAIDLVVFDTLARTTPGANENAAEDMGRALAHCKAIHEQTGATVLLVHHSGKDAARGARGWSGIKAACDFEIEVTSSAGGEACQILRCATLTKLKDGSDGERFWFRLNHVEMGKDADGDPLSSCIVLDAQAPLPAAAAGAGKWQRHVLAAHDELAGLSEAGVARGALVAAAAQREEKPKGRDRRRESAADALAVLAGKSTLVEHSDGLIYRPADLPESRK